MMSQMEVYVKSNIAIVLVMIIFWFQAFEWDLPLDVGTGQSHEVRSNHINPMIPCARIYLLLH